MDERTVAISLPSDLYTELGHTPMFRGRLKSKIQLDLAVGMFVSKEISLSRAAEYAGMALQDFIELLCNFGVPVVDYTEEMLEDDLAFVKGMQI
jgi:predicted HTH domain antitoxin